MAQILTAEAITPKNILIGKFEWTLEVEQRCEFFLQEWHRKCWSETQQIKLKKKTLYFGSNTVMKHKNDLISKFLRFQTINIVCIQQELGNRHFISLSVYILHVVNAWISTSSSGKNDIDNRRMPMLYPFLALSIHRSADGWNKTKN